MAICGVVIPHFQTCHVILSQVRDASVFKKLRARVKMEEAGLRALVSG